MNYIFTLRKTLEKYSSKQSLSNKQYFDGRAYICYPYAMFTLEINTNFI